MEELINKLKEKVKIIPVDSLEKQYKTVDDIYNTACMINDVFFLLLADDSVDVDEALNKLSMTDIINGYLLAYYDYSIEEVEEKSALLLELVKKENLNKDDVIYNYINLNIIVNDEEKKRRYKKNFPILTEDFIDEKEKELEQEREKLVQQLGDSSEKFINLLNELSSVKKFHNMYKNMCYCYSEDGFNFDKKVLKDFLQTTYDFALTNSLSIARRLAVKHRETHNILSLIIAVGDLKKELPVKKSSLRKKLAYCKKQNETNLSNVNMVENKLTNLFNKEIISVYDISKLKPIINDDELLNMLLVEVLKHNNKSITDAKNNEFGFSKKMEMLFRKYNYDYNKFSSLFKERLKTISEDNLCKILNLLSANSISLTINNLEMVISDGSYDIVKRVKALFNKRIIDSNYINEHIGILCNDECQKKFLTNINLLLDNDIDVIGVLNSNIDMGSCSTKEITNNLKLLNLYGIEYKDKKINKYEFLLNSRCFDVIDGFIEEGYDVVVKNHPEYIRTDYLQACKRVHISNLINDDCIKGERFKKNVLYEKDYFLSDSLLDENMCSHTENYENKIINKIISSNKLNLISEDVLFDSVVKKLDSSYLSDNNYLFGDTIISRIKFLRCYELFFRNKSGNLTDIVYNCLIYNSYLTDKELIMLREIAQNITKELTFVKK